MIGKRIVQVNALFLSNRLAAVNDVSDQGNNELVAAILRSFSIE